MKVIVQNLAVEYQDEGAEETILFLHGWKDNLHTFDALVPFFAKTHRVVRLDLPGFGKTEAPAEDWSVDDYVALVEGFIRKLNLSVDTIIAHSFGGRIAIRGVGARRLQPRKLVLIASAGVANRRTVRRFVLGVLAKVGGLVMHIPPLMFWRRALRKKLYARLGSDYLAAAALRQTFLNVIAEDLKKSAAEIAVPTLLIWGEGDSRTPLSEGERLSELIPDSQLRTVTGAGHFVHTEQPKEVAHSIQKFL